MQIIRVLIDTNVVERAGFHLARGDWPTILAAARRGRIRLLVPEIVIRELVAHYGTALSEQLRSLKRVLRELRKLQATDALQLPDVGSAQERQADYEAWLRGTIEHHGTILDFPAVDHSALVDRVLAGRKPFAAGEKGYRDALIWHTVLTAAQTDNVVFVTENTRDFAGPDKRTLADEFVEEIASAGMARDRVGLVVGLRAFVEQTLYPDQEVTNTATTYLNTPQGKTRLRELVDEHFEDISPFSLSIEPGVLPSWLEGMNIEALKDLESVPRVEAHALEEGTFLLSGVLDGLGWIGGTFDLALHSERVLQAALRDFEVWDSSRPDHLYIVHEQAQPVRLTFHARFRPPDELQDFEIDEAQFEGPFVPTATWRRPLVPPMSSALKDRVTWLRSTLADLLNLDHRRFFRAVRDPGLVEDIGDILTALENDPVSTRLSPTDSMAIAPDNLPSMLEESAGIYRLRAVLATLQAALDSTRSAGP